MADIILNELLAHGFEESTPQPRSHRPHVSLPKTSERSHFCGSKRYRFPFPDDGPDWTDATSPMQLRIVDLHSWLMPRASKRCLL